MSEPRGIYRPTTCTECGDPFYTDTAWDNGQLVLLATKCAGCSGQAALW